MTVVLPARVGPAPDPVPAVRFAALPASFALIGQCSGDRLVLFGTGPLEAQAQAAARLELLSPAIEPLCTCGHPSSHHLSGPRREACRCGCPKVNSAALTCPLTWGTLVQIATTFGSAWRPMPALAAWVAEQAAMRVAAQSGEGALAFRVPETLTPRDYQVSGALMIGLCGSAILADEPGPQPTDTPVATPAGWEHLGDLRPGDEVLDVHGRPACVDEIKFYGEQSVYRVTFSDRTSTLATGDHRWQVYTPNDRKRGTHGRKLTTDALIEAGLHRPDGGARYFLPQQPVIGDLGDGTPPASMPLDPYAYGALLGDGALGGVHISFSCPDAFVRGAVTQAARLIGTTSREDLPTDGRCASVVFHRDGDLHTVLDDLGARVKAVEKRVHPRYRFASREVRADVLAGLLDTDGSVDPSGNGVEFSSASPFLAADVAWLARSLGAVVTESDPQPAGYRDADGERVECQPRHRVLARFPADGPSPFWLHRKSTRWEAGSRRTQRRNPPRTIERIEPAGTAPVCCISIDRDAEHERVYLTDTALIPTSNTGKTVSTILGLLERAARFGDDAVLPVVVVAPTAVVDSWLEHFAWLAPRWKAVAWRGSPKTRVNKMGTADVYVASYGTASRDAATGDQREIARGKAPLLAIGGKTGRVVHGPRYVVADEVHKIKGQTTSQSWAVRRLAAADSCAGFIGLSGTPITHHPGDLWPALYCLAPGFAPSRERWLDRYCITLNEGYSSTVLGLNELREAEFRTTILGQFRRVAKQDVLDSLPPKVYTVRRVELPKRYREAYDKFEAEMLAELPDSEELEAMGVLAQMGRLIQLACSACDVKVTYETVEDPDSGLPVEKKHQHVTMRAPSWKVEELESICEERGGADGGTQFAVFAPSRQLMVLAGETMRRAGYRVGYVIGVGPLVTVGPDAEDLEAADEPVIIDAPVEGDEQTAAVERSKGVTMATRRADVAAFQRGELDIIFVTTGAGGVGLTLTAASTEVFLARPWSLVESLQAEDRCHRIGSERHECIEIIDVVATKTIETRVRDVLVERGDQLAALVQDRRIVEQLLGGEEVRDLRRHESHETPAAAADRALLAARENAALRQIEGAA